MGIFFKTIKSFGFGLAGGAAIFGVPGSLIVAGVTALFSGPVALTAAIGAGVFGVLGAFVTQMSVLTAPRLEEKYDDKYALAGGLAAAALLAFGAYAGFNYLAHQKPSSKSSTTLSTTFNDTRLAESVRKAYKIGASDYKRPLAKLSI